MTQDRKTSVKPFFLINKKIIYPTIFIGLLLLLWEQASGIGLRAQLFPAPSTIFRQLITMLLPKEGSSILLCHLLASLRRLTVSLIIGSFFGIIFGIASGLRPYIDALTKPFVSFFLPIPGIALAPIFMILFGFGDPAIITAGSLAAFFPVLFNTSSGIRTVNPTLINAARIMGATRWQKLVHVYLPWSAIHIFTGFKLGISRSWRTVIAVELVAAADWGLGYMIMQAVEYLQMKVVYVGIFVMALLYLFIEKALIGFVERRTIYRWGYSPEQGVRQ